MVTDKYQIITDETCATHGGKNFAYQYDDENFVRNVSICEGCTNPTTHVISPEAQAARASRSHERPAR